MSARDDHSIEIMDDAAPVTLIEVLRVTHTEQTFVVELVDAGVVSPLEQGRTMRSDDWRFARRDLRRIQTARRLMTDLQVNGCGAALILDLLEERESLLKRLRELHDFAERL